MSNPSLSWAWPSSVPACIFLKSLYLKSLHFKHRNWATKVNKVYHQLASTKSQIWQFGNLAIRGHLNSKYNRFFKVFLDCSPRGCMKCPPPQTTKIIEILKHHPFMVKAEIQYTLLFSLFNILISLHIKDHMSHVGLWYFNLKILYSFF